jgi:hypothetical protein
MQTGYATIADIFGLPRRYAVPLFQRPYVWEKQAQWEPLWEDVRRLADAARVGGNPQPHFLGSIVLEKGEDQSYPERRNVIDGQQRLTTLQILLKAAHDAFATIGELDRATQLRSLLRNHAIGTVDEEQTFKVLPTNVDREGYRAIMLAAKMEDLANIKGRISDAYRYFHGEIAGWLAANAPGPGQARDALFVTLNQRFKCVVLDLDQTDEAQVIFETLNARGTPLLPADLVKNWLLREVERRGLHSNLDHLYGETWQQFDRDHEFWRKLSGRGHAARARIDTYLANYLGLQLRRPVPATHLYSEFLALQKKYDPPGGVASGQQAIDPVERLRDLKRHTEAFRRVDEAVEPGRIGTFLHRLKAMDVVSLTPFLLMVFDRRGQDEQLIVPSLEALESFLVRRMICGLDTRGYNYLFVELLAHVSGAVDDSMVANAVGEFLTRSDAENSRWPSDEEFTQAWLSQPLYKRLTRPRLRMLLLAFEHEFHSAHAETVVISDKDLQIEHILPQSWEAHWPLPDGVESTAAAHNRGALLHTIGNLTLVTKKLNPSMSNAPWIASSTGGTSKRAALNDHSVLRLNHLLVEGNPDAWDEKRIVDRSTLLAKRAISIWPGPLPRPSTQ